MRGTLQRLENTKLFFYLPKGSKDAIPGDISYIELKGSELLLAYDTYKLAKEIGPPDAIKISISGVSSGGIFSGEYGHDLVMNFKSGEIRVLATGGGGIGYGKGAAENLKVGGIWNLESNSELTETPACMGSLCYSNNVRIMQG